MRAIDRASFGAVTATACVKMLNWENASDQFPATAMPARRSRRIVANHVLETELEKLQAAVSTGYARGKLLPSDRKDWYD